MMALHVALLGDWHTDGQSLLDYLRKDIPADFTHFPNGEDLLQALSKNHFDAVVLDASALASSGVPLWQQVAKAYPALPVFCWGSTESSLPSEPRSAPLQMVRDSHALRQALQAEEEHRLRGRLSGVSLPGLLQMLQYEQRSCQLRLRHKATSGDLFLRHGRLIHASHEHLSPVDAALEMLLWTPVDVVFERLPPAILQTLREPLDHLLLEAARLRDERQEGDPIPSRSRGTAGRLNSGKWLLPTHILGGADGLLVEVMGLPGILLGAVVDTEHRLLVALRKQRDIPTGTQLHSHISDAHIALCSLLLNFGEQESLEDVFLTTNDLLIVLRPLRDSPQFLLCAVFERSIAPLGLMRAQITRLAEGFLPAQQAG
ncbi:MAG: DUF4388 domain-containing protein [Myxococcales bacterium]|nr:DUF4388 domain-containing protein [Polyangiaceae bacterium]MDW8251925.1 DUF4388 domain-containing protein [Myxococcales bacterium]